jgi:hypothetical protein
MAHSGRPSGRQWGGVARPDGGMPKSAGRRRPTACPRLWTGRPMGRVLRRSAGRDNGAPPSSEIVRARLDWPPRLTEGSCRRCVHRVLLLARRGGYVDAGPTPRDHPASDDAGEGYRHHPPPSRRRPHRRRKAVTTQPCRGPRHPISDVGVIRGLPGAAAGRGVAGPPPAPVPAGRRGVPLRGPHRHLAAPRGGSDTPTRSRASSRCWRGRRRRERTPSPAVAGAFSRATPGGAPWRQSGRWS